MVPKSTALPLTPPTETVVEFLKDLIGRLERGEENASEGLCVHYLTPLGPGPADGCKHRYWRWNLHLFAHLGLLQIASQDIIKRETE